MCFCSSFVRHRGCFSNPAAPFAKITRAVSPPALLINPLSLTLFGTKNASERRLSVMLIIHQQRVILAFCERAMRGLNKKKTTAYSPLFFPAYVYPDAYIRMKWRPRMVFFYLDECQRSVRFNKSHLSCYRRQRPFQTEPVLTNQ
jgi:hypothetical protein